MDYQSDFRNYRHRKPIINFINQNKMNHHNMFHSHMVAMDLGSAFESLKNALDIKELSTTKDKVLEAAKHHPQFRTLLEVLYPEAFEDDKVFCKIGAILTRDSYPNNFYAVLRSGGRLRLYNISGCKHWDENKTLYFNDPYKQTVTFGEFKKLIGNQSVKEWGIVTDVKIRKP